MFLQMYSSTTCSYSIFHRHHFTRRPDGSTQFFVFHLLRETRTASWGNWALTWLPNVLWITRSMQALALCEKKELAREMSFPSQMCPASQQLKVHMGGWRGEGTAWSLVVWHCQPPATIRFSHLYKYCFLSLGPFLSRDKTLFTFSLSSPLKLGEKM